MLDPDKTLLTAKIDIPFSGIFESQEFPEFTSFIKRILERSETDDEYTDISIAFNIGDFLILCARYARKHNIPTVKRELEDKN